MAHLTRSSLKQTLRRLRILRSGTLGVFGAPNAGKSSIANLLCSDFAGELLSSVSSVPHETRGVRRRERLRIKAGDAELVVDVLDTPGLASEVTTRELTHHGLNAKDAEARATDAIRGMLDAVAAIQKVEGILLVVDSTRDPNAQVNDVVLASARARKTPVVVIANKIDLSRARPKRVEDAFGAEFPVVRLSTVTRENVPELYRVVCDTFE